MPSFAVINTRLFNGQEFLDDKALVVGEDGLICDITSPDKLPAGIKLIDGKGHILAPGLIDIQVNGGGGVLFNDVPSVASLSTMMMAHRKFGTTAMMPTLITDTPQKMEKAVAAVSEAIASEIPGIIGLHLEGPYLNTARKGIHSENLITKMPATAVDMIAGAKTGRTIVTLAPENQDPALIKELCMRGVIVCAGHSDATYEQTEKALDNGVRGFTHLFNAMRPIHHREPGISIAALNDHASWCGIILDGFHVHYEMAKLACRAKSAGKMMLVTDAMPTVGAENPKFIWNGEEIFAKDGRCALANGTLAGSDLNMIAAVRNAVEHLGLDLAEALRMASLYPAQFLKLDHQMGLVAPGMRADLILFDNDFKIQNSWIGGK